MSQFLEQTRRLVPGFTFAPISTGPVDPLETATMMDGSFHTFQKKQIPVKSTLTNYTTTRYNATGSYSAQLTNGGQVQVPIIRASGTGKCNGIPYIRMIVTNTDGALNTQQVPAPLLIQNVQCLTPDGSPIQNHDGSGLWWSIIEVFDTDFWANLQVALNSSVTYELGVPLPFGTSTLLFVPLVGNLFAMDFFIPAVDGDMIYNVYFWPATSTLISGPNVTLTFLSIDVPMEQLSSDQLAKQIEYRRSREVTYVIPYERIQRLQQTWNASQLYSIPLNAFKGDATLIRFMFRNTLVGRDLLSENIISSFQFRDSAGNAISGPQFIDDIYNRQIQQADWCLGRASAHHFVYVFVWSAAKTGLLSVLLHGVKYGAFPFTTNETLQVNTAVAGTNEVLSLQYNHPADITQGTFIIAWSTPQGGTQYTAPITFNATALQVQTAIQLLNNFRGTCTVTGNQAANWVITFTGHYATRPMSAAGYQMCVITAAEAASNELEGLRVIVTVPGITGIVSGSSQILDLHMYTTSLINTTAKGGIRVFHSG